MSDFELPSTRYALSGDVNIAFQVMGSGPIDIILVPGVVSHVEFLHEFAGNTALFLRRLPRSPASSRSTSVARDCRTGSRALRRLSRG